MENPFKSLFKRPKEEAPEDPGFDRETTERIEKTGHEIPGEVEKPATDDGAEDTMLKEGEVEDLLKKVDEE